MTNLEPSVGRIVHYVSYGTPGGEYPSVCRAAIITELPGQATGQRTKDSTTVNLCVLNPGGMFFNKYVKYSDQEHHGGTWHWPERIG